MPELFLPGTMRECSTRMRLSRRIIVIGFFCQLSGGLVHAGLRPENVVVVVNDDSRASVTVAKEYIHLRKIPASNVIHLTGLPDHERATVDQFRKMILRPILAEIDRRGLTEQIDCVAYSSDIPVEINFRGDFGKGKVPRVIGTRGSITGLTYLADLVLDGEPGAYTDLRSNHYFRRPVIPYARPRPPPKTWTKEDFEASREIQLCLSDEKYEEAEKLCEKLARKYPGSSATLYNLACCRALLAKPEQAMSNLKDAVSAGWLNWEHAISDSDLKSLRRRRDFRKLVERMKRVVARLSVQPAAAFRRAYGWRSDGSRSVSGEGRHYLLSTVLGVTSGRGNSVAEVVACLRRAAAADGHPPQGTIYLMTNGDIRTKVRRWAFAGTVRLLAERGVKAEIVQGNLPNGRRDIAGLVAGIAEFNMQKSGCLILPGAICEHLTSSGGVMRSGAGQTPLTEFIRHGAAGSCGTVMEPFAIQQKFPVAFMHVHYVDGCSLAEAFYQSVSGPYQLLVVGDPLCQPWARPQ